MKSQSLDAGTSVATSASKNQIAHSASLEAKDKHELKDKIVENPASSSQSVETAV